MKFDNRVFERGSIIYPQPIAIGCGRIVRSMTPQERLDSILKCSEVLTRYVAAVSLASFAARDDANVTIPKWPTEVPKNLSFGDFLSVIQSIAGVDSNHPLKAPLMAAFKDKGQGPGTADSSLVSLLELRNQLGHDLASISEARALSIFESLAPDQRLAEALESLETVLALPLFLIEEQHLVSKRIIARRLLLMGESADPAPEEIEPSGGFAQDRVLYLGIRGGVLSLMPFILWGLVKKRENYGIYFIHAIKEDRLHYVTVNSDNSERNGGLTGEFTNRTSGVLVPSESNALRTGQDYVKEWSERRKALEEIAVALRGDIPWDEFDLETVRWFARHLGAADDETSIRGVISEQLLDGRDRLSPDEIRQLVLAFGREQQIKKLLGREMIDCRANKTPELRWDERLESSANVLECLKLAVGFFGRHVGIGGVTLDGLKATAGSADYIAMREALVNLFIHQDYAHGTPVAQIEITNERALFFNAGRSLVSSTALVEGGKSQSRNPLLSRALRLIGFAELAGSGLREVQRVWRNVNRRPPLFESSPSANTFTLILDWRELPEVADKFWKQRLGVVLSPHEATALLLSAENEGVGPQEIASAAGILVDEANEVMSALKTKALADEKKNRIYIKAHLRNLVEEAKQQ